MNKDLLIDFVKCYREKRAELLNKEWFGFKSWSKRMAGRDAEFERLLSLEEEFNIKLRDWLKGYMKLKSIETPELKDIALFLKSNSGKLLGRSLFLNISITLLAVAFLLPKLGISVPSMFLGIFLFSTLFLLLERFFVNHRVHIYQEIVDLIETV